VGFADGIHEGVGDIRINIIQSSTLSAKYVIVLFEYGVIPPLPAAGVDLTDNALFSKAVEVTVDRTQTDSGKTPFYTIVNIVRRRMEGNLAQLIQNHSAL
jgi:hypothetical protein